MVEGSEVVHHAHRLCTTARYGSACSGGDQFRHGRHHVSDGADRKVTPLRMFLLLAICGTALFTVKCLTADAVDLSSRALLLGIVAGLSQYLSIKLVGRAMMLGPFSLVWCVLSLAFAPVALYAAAVQGSPQHWTLWLAVGAAALCCILAAAGHGDASSTTPATVRAKLAYGSSAGRRFSSSMPSPRSRSRT